MVDMEADEIYANVLQDLDRLDGEELRNRYLEILGQFPPAKASIHFIKGQIAWTLQARLCGKDPNDLRKSILQKYQNSNSRLTKYKPGTRLVREWQGKIYEITITDRGYEYDGASYRSLSQVANVITGSHCSGPRFFGLQKTK